MLNSPRPALEPKKDSPPTSGLGFSCAMGAALVIVFGTMAGVTYLAPTAPGIVAVVAGAAVLGIISIPFIIWNEPRMGFYFIFVGAMIFEAIPMSSPPVPTANIPFWYNISTGGELLFHTRALAPIKTSAAEILMVWTFLCWLIRMIVSRTLKFERGAFLNWILAYICCVTAGFMNGVAHGANTTMALWEVRSQYYFLLMYVMTTNMVTERRHVTPLLWIAVLANGFKALVGVYVFNLLHGEISDQGILSHEESLFFNLLFFAIFLTRMTGADKRLRNVATLLLPLVLFAHFENQRRAGIAAFVVAFLPMFPLVWTSVPAKRKQLSTFLITVVLVMAAYLPVAWNSSQIWALPARAIRSQIDPSDRDASSDAYREDENIDQKYTRDTSPWTGYGYGRPFLQKVPLIELTTDFLHYMGHNSMLWVWMRLGHIGFYCMLMIIASVCIKGAQMIREAPDPMLQTIGGMAIAAMIMLFVYGKYDLQFCNYRTMVMTSIFIAVLGILPKLYEQGVEADARAQRTRRPVVPPSDPTRAF